MSVPRRRSGFRTAIHALRLQWIASPGLFASLVALTVLSGLLPLGVAWLTKLLLEAVVTPEPSAGRAAALALALALAGAAGTSAAYVGAYVGKVLQQRTTLVVEAELFACVNAFHGLEPFESPAFHDRLRLAEEGAQEAPRAICGFAQQSVTAAVSIAGLAGAVLLVWPPLAGILVAASVPAFLAQRETARRYARVDSAIAGVLRRRYFFRALLTDVRAAKEVRLFGLEQLLHGRLVDSLRTAAEQEIRVERRALTSQVGLILATGAGVAAGMAVTAERATRGELTVGDVGLFLAAVAGVQAALVSVVGQVAFIGRHLLLFGHYLDLTSQQSELANGTGDPGPLTTGVTFEDVWFRYGDDGPWVLRGLTLTIPAGASVALVGLNGSGKSTLVKLLCRFYDPDHGRVLWDGRDIRDCDVRALRRRIGAAFQDHMTYDLTARENIGLGAIAHLDDLGRIDAAARAAEADRMVGRLPDGYETLLSRTFADDGGDGGGAMLSGGQWQRIALARSLMRDDADVLILDEPNAGLDPYAEARIHSTLVRVRRGRTSLLVSHRLSALREADHIAVLDDGVIAEAGTHEELLALQGAYADLFHTQARGYEVSKAADEVGA